MAKEYLRYLLLKVLRYFSRTSDLLPRLATSQFLIIHNKNNNRCKALLELVFQLSCPSRDGLITPSYATTSSSFLKRHATANNVGHCEQSAAGRGLASRSICKLRCVPVHKMAPFHLDEYILRRAYMHYRSVHLVQKTRELNTNEYSDSLVTAKVDLPSANAAPPNPRCEHIPSTATFCSQM